MCNIFGVRTNKFKNYLAIYAETLIYIKEMIEKPETANIPEKTAKQSIAKDFVDFNVLLFQHSITYFTVGVVWEKKQLLTLKILSIRVVIEIILNYYVKLLATCFNR